MTKTGKNSRNELRDLVEQFVGTCTTDTSIPDDCFELDGESSELALRVLDSLGPDTAIDSPEELFWFLGEHIADLAEPSEEELIRATEALAAPVKSFDFGIRLGPGSESAFSSWLGGPQALDLGFDNEASPNVWLLGKVDAATQQGAVLQVERTLDAYLGASYVLGLTRFLPRREEAQLDARFQLDEGRNQGTAVLAATYAERLNRSIPVWPDDLSDLERAHLDRNAASRAIERHFELLRRALAGPTNDAQVVRNACRHAINAVASIDHGVMVTLAFSAMEGLLLSPTSKSDTLAGLREAIAHTFGKSLDDRARLRKRVNELYEVRSVFVHTGQAKERYRVRQEVLELMRGVIRAQVERLPWLAPEPRPTTRPEPGVRE